jgi:dTDP-glucose 4,6-dehydratase
MYTYCPRHILITGGAGFIGCHFVQHLLDNHPHAQVINLDLLTYAGSRDNLKQLSAPDRHTFILGNICDRGLVEHVLREYDLDTIVHFAAESHVDRSITGPGAFVETNVVGTFTLLDAARVFWLQEKGWDASRCRFHHVSTDEVYGALGPDDAPFDETTVYAPNSPYAASKAGADHLVRSYHATYGLPTLTTHCSNNYGPYQHDEKLIPTIIRSCLQGKPIPVYGDGSNMRDWLYVGDHCRAIDVVLCLASSGETYNIGGDNNWNNIDVVHAICQIVAELTGKPLATYTQLIRFVQDRPGHDWRYAIDATKIQQGLGWKPAETFETGLRKTVEWYWLKYTQKTS